MTISSTLVNVAEDAELRMVQVLETEAAQHNLFPPSFVKECQICIETGKEERLLQTILSTAAVSAVMTTLIRMDLEDEAVAVVSLLTALLHRIESKHSTTVASPATTIKTGSTLAMRMADAIVQAKGDDGDDRTAINIKEVERKLSLLSVLYNTRPNWIEKCQLLNRMFVVVAALQAYHASEQQQQPFLAPESALGQLLIEQPAMTGTTTVPRIVAMLDAWEDIPITDRRALYKSIHTALPAASVGGDVRKQRFVLLLVTSYQYEPTSDVDMLVAAREAAVGAIRDPVSLFLYQRNLLHQPAIQALADPKTGTASDRTLFGLLQVFQEGKLVDYEAFLKSNGGPSNVLQPWNLDADACIRYMRILSLCSLASEHEEIPYTAVAETLHLSPSSTSSSSTAAGASSDAATVPPISGVVESWVIAAVNSGLLQAKMDQLEQKIMVERSVVRQFDMGQWKALQSRLSSWKQNVGSILASLKQQQQQQQLPPQQQ